MAKGNIIVVTASQKCSNHYILGVRVLSAIGSLIALCSIAPRCLYCKKLLDSL